MSAALLAILPLAFQAQRVPDKAAVVDDRPDRTRTVWTFAELNRQANRLAHVLRDLGVEAGDKVVWCGPNSPGVVRAMHARAKVGFTAVPLNYRLAPEEAAYIVDDSDAVVAYVDAEHGPMFAAIRPSISKVRAIVVFGGEPPAGMLDGDALVAAASDAEPPPPSRVDVLRACCTRRERPGAPRARCGRPGTRRTCALSWS